jgi:GntR family transcriptional repressor for pyruvate dehydrogenase complex
MPFQSIEAEKLSKSVVQQIEQLILRGILRPGERLPAERDLAEKLAVSRPSLREALGELQSAGLLIARANAGIFVAEVLGSAFSPALMRLFATHEEAVYDYLAFRKDLEGLAAERTALEGSDTDLQVINAIYQKMVASKSNRPSDEQARLDAQFHMSICEAGHNVVMLHMMRSMYELLEIGVFYNRQATFRQRSGRDQLLEQHREINAALQARDPHRAKEAVHKHLDFVAGVLQAQDRADRNEKISKLRFLHIQ